LAICLFRLTVRTYILKNHEAIDSQFNYGQTTQCIVAFAIDIYIYIYIYIYIRSYLKPLLRYKFFILATYHPDFLHLLEHGLRIHGYFLKPEGVREQKRRGTLL